MMTKALRKLRFYKPMKQKTKEKTRTLSDKEVAKDFSQISFQLLSFDFEKKKINVWGFSLIDPSASTTIINTLSRTWIGGNLKSASRDLKMKENDHPQSDFSEWSELPHRTLFALGEKTNRIDQWYHQAAHFGHSQWWTNLLLLRRFSSFRLVDVSGRTSPHTSIRRESLSAVVLLASRNDDRQSSGRKSLPNLWRRCIDLNFRFDSPEVNHVWGM